MRIQGPIEYVGFFWIPEVENKKVSGILKIVDGGEITLSLIGSFDKFEDEVVRILGNESQKGYDHNRIVGAIEKVGLVTLDGCSYRNRSISFDGGVIKSEIIANMAILGVVFDAEDDILLNRFDFSIEYLEKWLQLKCFQTEFSQLDREVLVKYSSPELSIIELQEDISMQFVFQYTIPMPKFKSATIDQTCFVRLASASAKPLDDFVRISRQITNLICLSATKTLNIKNVSGRSNEIYSEFDGKKIPTSLNIYYRSRPFSEKSPAIEPHEFLFSYYDLAETLQNSINAWLTIHDKLNPVVGLYFAAKSGAHRSLEGRFLALTQAVETHHRRTSKETVMGAQEFEAAVANILRSVDPIYSDLVRTRLTHGNELSLRLRIQRLVGEFTQYFGNSKTRASLVQKIVSARNYLTHYDENSNADHITPSLIWVLSLKLEVLLQLLFLKEIGFKETQIDRVVAKSEQIIRVLKMEIDKID